MKELITLLLLFTAIATYAQVTDSSDVKTIDGKRLSEVTVSAHQSGRVKTNGIGNTEFISSKELLRAACCNLGESFTTNPSVDVNYADAATGAQQIKLLGLSGTYVQMLTENIPNYRGLAAPFSLSYIPGPWMQSIQVSKGASSVKNGYESITGQINVEFKKPQATPLPTRTYIIIRKGSWRLTLVATSSYQNDGARLCWDITKYSTRRMTTMATASWICRRCGRVRCRAVGRGWATATSSRLLSKG